jgi:NADH:ubiquinone oxidoreductase subunit E
MDGTPFDESVVDAVLRGAASEQHALLPVLQEVQRRLGFVPKAALQRIADALNVSRAEVYGVASFYHDLRDTPAGVHRLQICAAEACQAVGCRELGRHVERRLGIAFGETTLDGRVTLERAYCFGNCAAGPTVRVDDTIHGRVSVERIDALIETLRGAR